MADPGDVFQELLNQPQQPSPSGALEPEPQLQEELTEADVRNIEHTLTAYDPLPEELESTILEPEYGFDASLELIGRFDYISHLAEVQLPKFRACTDVELLRRVVSVILTAMRVVAVIDEWAPPTDQDHNFGDDDAPSLRGQADRFRQRITPVFDALLDRIRALENRD